MAKRRVYEIPKVKAELIQGHPFLEGRQLFVSGCLDAVAGLWEQAEESINRAMHIMEKHLFYTEQAEMMFIFGQIALDQTRRPQGISLLHRALRIAETYYLHGMAKKIIEKLDKLEEVTLVTCSLEKQASRVSSGEDYVVESLSSQGEVEIVGGA